MDQRLDHHGRTRKIFIYLVSSIGTISPRCYSRRFRSMGLNLSYCYHCPWSCAFARCRLEPASSTMKSIHAFIILLNGEYIYDTLDAIILPKLR